MKNGIDLVKINRFEKLKTNNTFMNNVFNENELNYIKRSNYNNSTIAGLYAAKEAFLKALKLGINNYSLKNIEITHNENNCPEIILHNELQQLNYNISLSISHDDDYAIASVIIY